MDTLVNIVYLLVAIGFILVLKLMDNPNKVKTGNYVAAIGGAVAVIISINEAVINIGTPLNLINSIVLALGATLGSISFTGSIVVYFKLKIGNQNATRVLSRLLLLIIIIGCIVFFTIPALEISFLTFMVIISVFSLIYGVAFTSSIRTADMPILVSFLNVITGIATISTGIVFNSPGILIGGVIVTAAGVYLTIRMCAVINRSLGVVLAGKNIKCISQNSNATTEVQRITCSETASLLASSKNIAIIPGYGMAVAQAQQACYELQKNLMSKGAQLTYIIHPVAGRMPGHMDVLLAEANIDYKYIKDMVDVNDTMEQFDTAIIIGANDVVNPAAETDENSTICGMPILKAYMAKQIIVMKRGMATGYSGASNPLLKRNNCKILFGDANESLTKIIDELKKI